MNAEHLCVGVVCAGLASAAFAQQPPLEQKLQTVEVTGSRIKRVEAEGASAVQVLDQEDIRRTGASTLQELFEAISNVGRGLSDTAGRGTFSAGASAVDLRGIGKQSTLVLLNYRRVAPYPLAEYSEIFTNIDSLPLEAVERVEILRTGASAIYGSDAVAGVINVITRASYQGLYVRASHRHSLFSGSFGSNTASITGGLGDLSNDKYNVLANLEVYHRDGVVWRDVLSYVNPQASAPFPGFGTYSTYSYPGNVLPAGALPGCDPALVIGGLCRFDRYRRFEAVPAADRVNLLASAKLRLDGEMLGFAELLYSNTKTKYISPYLPYGVALGSSVWGDPATNQARTFVYRGLPAGHPLNPTGADDAEFRYRFVDGPNETTGQASQYRLLAGLRGTWDRFEWESAAGMMGGSADQRTRGGFSDSGFKQVIGNYDPAQVDPLFFNRDYKIGQPNSAAVLSTLFPEHGYKGSTAQVFLDGKVTGAVMQFEARPVGLAAGFDLRHEKFAVTPSANLLSGDIVGEGLASSNAARTHGALFGELSLPLTPSLELQAAGRLDKFPGFDAHLSPKLGMRFEASKSIVLRGSVEAGFRAPNLSESAPSTKFSFITVPDPKRCTQAQALSRDLLTASAALPATDPQKLLLAARADNVADAECSPSIASIVRNNPDLQPESSRSASLGLVFKPARDTDLSLDLWSIQRKNEIGLQDVRTLLDTEGSQTPGPITRADLNLDRSFTPAERAAYGVTAGSLVAVTGRFENLSRIKTSGADFAMRSSFATPIGRLDARINGT